MSIGGIRYYRCEKQNEYFSLDGIIRIIRDSKDRQLLLSILSLYKKTSLQDFILANEMQYFDIIMLEESYIEITDFLDYLNKIQKYDNMAGYVEMICKFINIKKETLQFTKSKLNMLNKLYFKYETLIPKPVIDFGVVRDTPNNANIDLYFKHKNISIYIDCKDKNTILDYEEKLNCISLQFDSNSQTVDDAIKIIDFVLKY